jgi:hypothetical protein
VKTTWKTLAISSIIKRQKMPNGVTTTGFVLPIKISTRTTYRFRVYKPSTATLAFGVSATVTVKVV